MTKRNLGMALWFLAGWSAGGLLTGFLALPAVLGIVPGVVLALLVGWDPTGAIWSRPVTGKRTVRPINEFADRLPGNAPSGVTAKDRHSL